MHTLQPINNTVMLPLLFVLSRQLNFVITQCNRKEPIVTLTYFMTVYKYLKKPKHTRLYFLRIHNLFELFQKK